MKTDYQKVVTQYASQYLFSPSADSSVRKRVVNDFNNAYSMIAVDILQQGDEYPVDEKLTSFKKTLYLINSDFTPTDPAEFRKSKIDYHLLNMGKTGHYPMIENPGKFNFFLEEAIEKIGK